MQKIIVLYSEAGGGHKAAAKALSQILQKETTWQIKLINPFKEIGDKIDWCKNVSGSSSEDIYNRLVSAQEHSFFNLLFFSVIFKLNLWFARNKIKKNFAKLWARENPDMIISVTPFINGLVADSLDKCIKKIPFVTLITDYSECYKKIWIASKKQYLICPSAKLVQQALDSGHPSDKIFKTSGMLVAPDFFNLASSDKNTAKNRLGLNPDLPTGIVIFGSYASHAMVDIALHLNFLAPDIQMIFICGHSNEVKELLEHLPLNYLVLITGFVNDMQNYMQAADFMIGKPGGISISESAVMKLPMIVVDNFFTLLQERYNARWLVDNGIGVTVRNFNNISTVVSKLLLERPAYAAVYKNMSNGCLQEVPLILKDIFLKQK